MRKNKYIGYFALTICAISASSLLFTSCSESEAAPTGYNSEQVAEALYTVLKSDRKVYASKIVNRLVKEEKVITAHEEWKENQALLLPAQFIREGAEEEDDAEKPLEFSYSLQSLWPLNFENAIKKTPAVDEGLKAVSDPESEYYGKKWTGEETRGGQLYFVGIYPDRAVAAACWTCHNDHENRQPEYPEFKKNDVMGGIVIRIPKN